MKLLNKIVKTSIILSTFTLLPVLADNSDCGKFGAMSFSDGGGSFSIVDNSWGTSSNRYTNFLTIEQQEAIITKSDLNTALLNLKKFCCENKKGNLTSNTCKKDAPFFNSNGLDSQYLFDHLFDVIMRRLNGINDKTNIYTETKMTVDDKGSARRERIDEQAESTGGSNPQIISNKYEEVRGKSIYNITPQIYATFGSLSNQDFLNYVSGNGSTQDSESIANAMKKYDERTLYDRYINACALSEYFYSLLDLGVNSEDKTKIINKLTSDNLCDKAVEKQINSENNYVKLVTQRSSNQFLSNYVEGYTSYLAERQKTFQKLWKDITDRWLDVIKAVPCLQHICQK